MDRREIGILEALDHAVSDAAVTPLINEIASHVERKLSESPDDVLAWEPIPLGLYRSLLPEGIQSSWVFILRADTVTGAERHPNSHQRMVSYRGHGDFQTRTGGDWRSHLLVSDRSLPLERRWISIPPNVWHQGVVPGQDWVVVSFHTAAEDELIEERPSADAFRQRKYAGSSRAAPDDRARRSAME